MSFDSCIDDVRQEKFYNVFTIELSAKEATHRGRKLCCHTEVSYVRFSMPSHVDFIFAPVQLDHIVPTILIFHSLRDTCAIISPMYAESQVTQCPFPLKGVSIMSYKLIHF